MIYAGGIWSIAVLYGLAFGYARVFNAPRWVYFLLPALALLIIALSQTLPDSHMFNQSVRDDLVGLFWLGVIAVPVGGYAMLIRLARKKAEARHDP